MFKNKGLHAILGLLLLSSAASAQLQITTTTVPTATQYQSYSTALNASGGTPPYTWSVVASTSVSLPEGMVLNPATGVVSATQVVGQGGYAVTMQVTDSASPSHNVVTGVVDFGVNSDTSFAGCQMFPADNIYNQRIDQLPVDTTASHQIPSSYLSSPIHPDFGHGFYSNGAGGIPWMRVPANQPLINVNLANAGQMDGAGTYSWPFPAPPNVVVEQTLDGLDGADHHILILQMSVNNITGPQTGPCTLYETYQNTAVSSMFSANTWWMLAGLHYVLNSDEIAASTSTLDNGAQDSPGIPMVPLLLRYSEVPLLAQHPLRIAFPSPTNEWVWPGTGCCAGSGPPQGLLYRLKASVNWQATCPVTSNPQAATVLQTLQQYGAYMSDHGGTGYVGGVGDVRWDDDDLACIKKFSVADLEVVNNAVLEISSTSGQTKPYVVPATLANGTQGDEYTVTFSAVGGNPATRQWSVSAGALPPGLVLNASTGTISGIITASSDTPYSFSMTAKDTSSGYSSAAQAFSIAVPVMIPIANPVTVTVTSTPAGLKVSVDGTTYTTPHNFSWVQGAQHTLSTTSPQGTGTRYVFANWSDGGAQSHAVTLPAATITYTANFTTQYLLTTKASPADGGTIAAAPASTDGYYNSGASVQLTATAAAGHQFSAFSGGLTGSANPQPVVMSAARSVTADFVPVPKLKLGLEHNGSFTEGENGATYTVIVSNTSSTATSGAVTVSETLPAGMTLVSMAGTGWTCSSGKAACTRSDSLAGESAFPAIIVTVNVAANAKSPQVDSVSVSGGGAATVTTTDTTDIKK
jgi:uncharacterized repeat protein (TIGR01451 family)